MNGYCIKCERDVRYHKSQYGDFHVRFTDDALDVAECVGPFTFIAPPTEQKDWELHLEVPSLDELAEMDAVASELLTEFELV
jgi:hypothetical protein